MGSTPIGISGSRAAAVLGLSKYTTPLAVWQQIMEYRKPGFNAERGYILEPFEGNASTRFGLAFESSVIELTESATGETITDREGEYYIDGEVPITCHIDGRFSDSKIFEGKTSYIRGFDMNWGEPGTDRIPQEYQVQVQHNMMLTGADSCVVSALVFPRSPEEWEDEGWIVDESGMMVKKNSEGLIPESCESMQTTSVWAQILAQMGYFHTYEVPADKAIQAQLKDAYRDFWNRFILTEKEPEITDYDDIKRLFTAPKGELILPDHMIENCREYSNITKEIGSGGDLTKRKEQIKIDVLKYLRKETTVESDDAQEKIVLLDQEGNSIGSYNGKVFRVSKKA